AYAARPALSYALIDHPAASLLLGITAASYALPSVLLALPVGTLIDRVGERPLAVAGGLSLTVASLIMVFGQSNAAMLVASAAVLGLGHLLVVASGQARVANTVAPGRLDTAFGYYSLTASIGQALGPLALTLPGGTPTEPPLGMVFTVISGCSVLTVVLALLLPSSQRALHDGALGMIAVSKNLLRTPGIPAGLIASGMVLASIDVLAAYLPLIADANGLPVALVGAMLTVRAVASMVSRLGLGLIVRRLGRTRILVGSATSAAAFLVIMALPLHSAVLIAAAAAFGLMVGTCQPLTMSWVSSIAPPGTRGLAMSLRLATNRVAQTVVPALAGGIAAVGGGGGAVVLFAVAGGLVAAGMAPLVRRKPASGEAQDPQT
ncbi:MAG: MFS transporter, partial [Burkholderiales bacterium]